MSSTIATSYCDEFLAVFQHLLTTCGPIRSSGAATDGDPVLYVIFYLVEYLLDIKAKFTPPVNCRSLIKQNGNYKQAYFRRSEGAWNHTTTHFA